VPNADYTNELEDNALFVTGNRPCGRQDSYQTRLLAGTPGTHSDPEDKYQISTEMNAPWSKTIVKAYRAHNSEAMGALQVTMSLTGLFS